MCSEQDTIGNVLLYRKSEYEVDGNNQTHRGRPPEGRRLGSNIFFEKNECDQTLILKVRKFCLPIKTVNDSCASFLALAFAPYLTFSSSFYLFHSKPSTILPI